MNFGPALLADPKHIDFEKKSSQQLLDFDGFRPNGHHHWNLLIFIDVRSIAASLSERVMDADPVYLCGSFLRLLGYLLVCLATGVIKNKRPSK